MAKREGNWEEVVLSEVINRNRYHGGNGCPAGSGSLWRWTQSWKPQKKQRGWRKKYSDSLLANAPWSVKRREEEMTSGVVPPPKGPLLIICPWHQAGPLRISLLFELTQYSPSSPPTSNLILFAMLLFQPKGEEHFILKNSWSIDPQEE